MQSNRYFANPENLFADMIEEQEASSIKGVGANFGGLETWFDPHSGLPHLAAKLGGAILG